MRHLKIIISTVIIFMFSISFPASDDLYASKVRRGYSNNKKNIYKKQQQKKSTPAIKKHNQFRHKK